MKKLKELLHSEHPQREILAFTVMGIGLILICNDFYFSWPPFAVGLLNDDLVGGVSLVDGILFLRWVLSASDKVYANRDLLVITAGLLAFEVTAEFCHGYASDKPYMVMIGFLEVIALFSVFSIIGKTKKHDY